jgi:chemotaxis protein histidine kinase CheA
VDQSVVTIAGQEIAVVRLPGDEVAAVLRTFCEMLSLHYSTQVQKIRAHPAIYDKLILVTLKTNGGPQEAYVIIAEAIPIWLTSMHASRVAPQSRDLLRTCQRDAARTIRSKFFPDAQAQPKTTPKAAPKQAPAQPAPPPTEEQPHLAGAAATPHDDPPYWKHLYLGQYGLLNHIRELDAVVRQAKTELPELSARVTAVEQQQEQANRRLEQMSARLNGVTRLAQAHEKLLLQMIERMGQDRESLRDLSQLMRQMEQRLVLRMNHLVATALQEQQRQGELRHYLQALAQARGVSVSAIEEEVEDYFSVTPVGALTGMQWEQAVAWFKQQLGW